MTLKSSFLASVRPFYDADNEGKSAANQIERDKIKVTSGGLNKEERNQEEEEANKKEEENDAENNVDKEDEGKEEEQEEESEENEEGKENEEEPKELTPEQKQIKALERKVERLQSRIGKTAGERDQIKKDLKDAKAALEAKLADGEQPLTEEEVNRRAKLIADQTMSEREFERAQERLIKDAIKVDTKFMSKVNEMAQEVGPLPEFFVGALNDLKNENGGAVLNYLTDNHDEYEDLLKAKNPMKVMEGLIEISNKLNEATKPKPKKISNVPEPPKVPKGNSKTPDTLPSKPTENMKDFVRVRQQQVEARRKEKMGIS